MASAEVDPIKHVVVLMLENRSFDQMLGVFQTIYPSLDGIDPSAPPKGEVVDGYRHEQKPTAALCASNDPNHELASVLRQIGAPCAVRGFDCRRALTARLLEDFCRIAWSWIVWLYRWARGRLPKEILVKAEARLAYQSNFVGEYVRCFPNSTTPQRDEIMGYYPVDSLPALHKLARNFVICDRWFSSVPGPTWVNRFFVHTGTASGIARMPNDARDLAGYALHDQRTIYDELNDHGKTWRIYFHDTPQTLALVHQWQSQNKVNYRHIDAFEIDVAGPAAKFPAFVFIEPQYAGENPNDDHPPHDIMAGEALVARVYNAIRANESLWRSTLLVVVFDEHGGYYDHVEPPVAPAPDKCTLEFTFDRYGVRVPAILVSPWVSAGVFPDDKAKYFDHTSIGRYLCDKWGLTPLGDRMRQANSIGTALRLNDPPRLIVLPQIPPVPAGQPVVTQTPNENQIALDLLSQHLDQQAPVSRSPTALEVTSDTKPNPDVMRARVTRFLGRP